MGYTGPRDKQGTAPGAACQSQSRSKMRREETTMFGLGQQELMIVLVLVLILFGGAKIPQMMKGLGEGMKEFKKAQKDDEEPKKTESPTV